MITAKYTDENSAEVLKAKEVAKRQFKEQMDETIDYDKAVSFMCFDITIVNPFMDDTGRFDFTLHDAYLYYGTNNMDWFIDQCQDM